MPSDDRLEPMSRSERREAMAEPLFEDTPQGRHVRYYRDLARRYFTDRGHVITEEQMQALEPTIRQQSANYHNHGTDTPFPFYVESAARELLPPLTPQEEAAIRVRTREIAVEVAKELGYSLKEEEIGEFERHNAYIRNTDKEMREHIRNDLEYKIQSARSKQLEALLDSYAEEEGIPMTMRRNQAGEALIRSSAREGLTDEQFMADVRASIYAEPDERPTVLYNIGRTMLNQAGWGNYGEALAVADDLQALALEQNLTNNEFREHLRRQIAAKASAWETEVRIGTYQNAISAHLYDTFGNLAVPEDFGSELRIMAERAAISNENIGNVLDRAKNMIDARYAVEHDKWMAGKRRLPPHPSSAERRRDSDNDKVRLRSTAAIKKEVKAVNEAAGRPLDICAIRNIAEGFDPYSKRSDADFPLTAANIRNFVWNSLEDDERYGALRPKDAEAEFKDEEVYFIGQLKIKGGAKGLVDYYCNTYEGDDKAECARTMETLRQNESPWLYCDKKMLLPDAIEGRYKEGNEGAKNPLRGMNGKTIEIDVPAPEFGTSDWWSYNKPLKDVVEHINSERDKGLASLYYRPEELREDTILDIQFPLLASDDRNAVGVITYGDIMQWLDMTKKTPVNKGHHDLLAAMKEMWDDTYTRNGGTQEKVLFLARQVLPAYKRDNAKRTRFDIQRKVPGGKPLRMTEYSPYRRRTIADVVGDVDEVRTALTSLYPEEGMKLTAVISTEPADVLHKSTDQQWTSCETLGGMCDEGPPSDVEHHNAVVWLRHRGKQTNIGRIMLRWCNDEDGKVNVAVDPRLYPLSQNEENHVVRFVRKAIKDELAKDGLGNFIYCKTPYVYNGYIDAHAYEGNGGGQSKRDYITYGDAQAAKQNLRHGNSRARLQEWLATPDDQYEWKIAHWGRIEGFLNTPTVRHEDDIGHERGTYLRKSESTFSLDPRELREDVGEALEVQNDTLEGLLIEMDGLPLLLQGDEDIERMVLRQFYLVPRYGPNVDYVLRLEDSGSWNALAGTERQLDEAYEALKSSDRPYVLVETRQRHFNAAAMQSRADFSNEPLRVYLLPMFDNLTLDKLRVLGDYNYDDQYYGGRGNLTEEIVASLISPSAAVSTRQSNWPTMLSLTSEKNGEDAEVVDSVEQVVSGVLALPDTSVLDNYTDRQFESICQQYMVPVKDGRILPKSTVHGLSVSIAHQGQAYGLEVQHPGFIINNVADALEGSYARELEGNDIMPYVIERCRRIGYDVLPADVKNEEGESVLTEEMSQFLDAFANGVVEFRRSIKMEML